MLGWWVGAVADAVPGAVTDASDAWAVLFRAAGLVLLAVFAALLVVLPWSVAVAPAADGTASALLVVDAFYRAGALVFGGGHVVPPCCSRPWWSPAGVSADAFLWRAMVPAQAVPGPLFTFAAFLGAAMAPGWAGAGLALLAILGIFLPAFLLVAGALPWWAPLRQRSWARVLAGVNAAVVGLLLAALYQPVATSALHSARMWPLALVALAALLRWRVPPWAVVVATALTAGAAGLAAEFDINRPWRLFIKRKQLLN